MIATSCLAAAVGTAGATPGPGTFTKITTPSGATSTFHYANGATNQFVVAGQTSADVTSVDIDCVNTPALGGRFSVSLASGVQVTDASFSAVVTYSNPAVNCRLRAIPLGVAVQTSYLGSFTGPILYTDAFLSQISSGTTYGYTAISEEADGAVEQIDAGNCGVALVTTIATPSMEQQGASGTGCSLALPPQNLPNGTASSIKVDGHTAYLPSAVHDYLIGALSLPLAQPALTTSFAVTAAGDTTVTESAPLMRCSVSDTYPPTSTSCPNLVSAGVKFTRVSQTIRSAHQVRVRDTFVSTDSAAHTLALEYQQSVSPPQTGANGYVFPGHGTAFAAATPGQVVSGLGTKAATMLVRSDLYSMDGDPAAETDALTWSKAPSQIKFAQADQFDMNYALTVPAGGTAFLGFADSQNVTTAGVQSLGALAVGDMLNAPTITSPANGATLSSTSTTVTGALTAGANGLPTAVAVAGHAATITKTSATAATYKVTFTEAAGAHTFNATATDSAGNTKASTSITVHNK
ncbi:MAG TPA: hypothetical protein VGO03_04060 [Acidimicrobiia bacterium]|jgi:hypothetical protein